MICLKMACIITAKFEGALIAPTSLTQRNSPRVF
nr:MAG TPA: hypothetical protein [Caudoviricetes sp.]